MKRKHNLPLAVADIHGSETYPHLRGQVRFYQRQHCVLVEASVQGLPDNMTGFFGFHIHAGDNCEGNGFSGTGSHYNPSNAPHPYHTGDLPPLLSCGGNSYMAVATGRFRVADILGRTVVIHDMVDDFHTQPAGNAGTKIACGVIRKV